MSEKGPLEDLSEPDEALSSADEMSEGPGMVDEMWDAVTDGVFDNLHFDTFFVILFVSMLLFFFCFILPWTIDKIENMSKFELTPEMQEELKELMAKKARGEYTSKSPVMNRLMEHQQKRDAHEHKMQAIQAKIAAKHKTEQAAGRQDKLDGDGKKLRQRKGASKATADG